MRDEELQEIFEEVENEDLSDIFPNADTKQEVEEELTRIFNSNN